MCKNNEQNALRAVLMFHKIHCSVYGGWGKDEHSSLIFAIISAFIGVALGMLPYFAAAQIIIGMLAGKTELSVYLSWLGMGLAGYAARTFLLVLFFLFVGYTLFCLFQCLQCFF